MKTLIPYRNTCASLSTLENLRFIFFYDSNYISQIHPRLYIRLSWVLFQKKKKKERKYTLQAEAGQIILGEIQRNRKATHDLDLHRWKCFLNKKEKKGFTNRRYRIWSVQGSCSVPGTWNIECVDYWERRLVGMGRVKKKDCVVITWDCERFELIIRWLYTNLLAK